MPLHCCCVPGCSNRGRHMFRDWNLKKEMDNFNKKERKKEKHIE